MEQLAEEYGDRIDISVLSGGMIQADREGPIGEVAAYIAQAYQEVEAKTGVTFGEAFLKNILEPGTTIFSSEPPARALSTFKTYAPKQALSFAGRLQTAIYSDGMAPTDWSAYGRLAAEYDLPAGAFVQRMKSDDMGAAAAEEVALTARIGVQSFPTVLLNVGEEWVLLTRGYRPYAELKEALEKGLELVG